MGIASFAPLRWACLGWGLVVFSAPASTAAEWRRLDSPNFVVIGDVGPNALRDTAVRFESFRETLSRLLTTRATSSAVPTMVVVFSSQKAFTPFKSVYKGKPVDLDGLFVPGRDINYVLMVDQRRERTDRIIFHEYTHLMVGNTVPNIPVWLNEGLAEFYSTFHVDPGGREAAIGLPIVEHELLLAQSGLSLDELLNVDRDSPLYNEGARRSVFYAQSWALVHLIVAGKPSRAAELSAYLDDLARGMSEWQAWKDAFGASPPDRELPRYIQDRDFRYLRVKFANKLATSTTTPVAIQQADVDALLAGFLVQQQRYDEAEARLASALKADPANVTALAGMMRLEIARGSGTTAKPRLLGDDDIGDWFAGYQAGVALCDLAAERRGGPSDESVPRAARLRLEAVQRQHPDIPNVLARLAQLAVESGGRPSDDALRDITRARTLAPGRYDYAFVQALVLAQREQIGEARAVLGPLMTPAYPARAREDARKFMAYVGELETNKKASNAKASSSPSPPLPSVQLDATPPEVPASPSTGAETAAPTESSGRTGQGGTLRPEFRQLQAGEQRVDGALENIDCAAGAGATFHVRTAAGLRAFPAKRMADVAFITYRDDLRGNVSCGPLKEPMPVYVTWRNDGNGDAVVAIEFLPKPR